jgi:ribosome maturation factor RimP
MVTVEQITSIVEGHLDGSSQFLVNVEVRPGNKVVVEVDNDKSITVQELAALNRAIRDGLGEQADDCELQVSSPGMGRPFKVMRQYVKHTGRLVQVQFNDGRTLEGILEGHDDQQLQLRIQHPSKVKGRLPKLDKEVTTIPLADIKATKASITFN